jgi:stage II sporulation protein AA (anti-sigma F factor antagonist)
MARNFRMISEETNDRMVRIQLQGDFDGTSAHELVNMLDSYGHSCPRVAIDTEGLRSINSFGLNVFIIRLKLKRRSHAGIVFTGKFKSNFVQE